MTSREAANTSALRILKAGTASRLGWQDLAFGLDEFANEGADEGDVGNRGIHNDKSAVSVMAICSNPEQIDINCL
jgi:hypothetical protein